MKKLAFLLSLIFVLAYPSKAVNVRADTINYMRITDQITPLFADENCTELLFYLPYTYYVRVIDVDGNVAHVEYGTPAIYGYTFFDKLYSDNLNVENPFPDLKLTTTITTLLYGDMALKNTLSYVFAERNLRYFGQVESSNGYLYFVEYNGKIGYVKESDIYPFTLSNHENPLTFLPSESTDNSPSNTNKSPLLTPIRIIVISCLLLAGIIGVFISVKSKKSPSIEEDYYQEKYYE